jgi:aldehyde:ferredoxin oxidoreductase
VDFLVDDEQGRVLLTSMVACLFARGVYNDDLLADCLHSLGYRALADNMHQVSRHIQKMRWRLRLATGFDPGQVKIPGRFTEVTNWKGAVDGKFLNALMDEYATRIVDLARDE